MRCLHATLALSLTLTVSTPAVAQSQTVAPSTIATLSTQVNASELVKFTPRPSTNTQLDFETWDQLLKEMVFFSGPSLRVPAPRPQAVVGTRLVYGHTSRYRMEGNRVVFDTMNDEFIDLIDKYVTDLVDVGNRIDIPSLQKDEQLAYWLNLHNALVILAIAKEYPIDSPSKIKGADGTGFHDIKRVSISGVNLSLRDIREGIVYQNWSNPLVIYGFFHGTIGSPSIQRTAYTSDTILNTLRFSALEFANSLRGFHVRNNKGQVSRHYVDAAPYFFPNFDADLSAHLKPLMDDPAAEDLRQVRDALRVMRYADDIADLSKGDPFKRPKSQVLTIFGDGAISSFSSTTLDRAIEEHNRKFERIRRRGVFGTVIIEDIETPTDQTPGNTVD